MSFTAQELTLIDRMADALHVDDMPVRMLVRAHIARLAVSLREVSPIAFGDVVCAVERHKVIRAAEATSGALVSVQLCEWFALCEHKADGLARHPVLDLVPICVRCASRFDIVILPFDEVAP